MSNDATTARLERAREELLDLTLRNRLLNAPRNRVRAKALEVVDERGDEVFRLLVRERKSLYFLAAKETAADLADTDEPAQDDPALAPPKLPQPEIDEGQEIVAERHLDKNLQTKLDSDKLQSRLLGLYYDARTIEQEQGVAILYLAIGFLKWFEDESSDKARYAPLILVPVSLARTSARSRFRLELADDAICTNLSLEAKLKMQFSIDLPAIDDGDDWKPSDYFAQVAAAIRGAPRWEVCPDDVVLGLFSFSKFLLYRDLDPETWPEAIAVDRHPLVGALLGAGPFPETPGFADEGKRLDELIDPLDLTQVVDADSSQTIAIEEVRRGRNLVIQGPPGTGKSQTITNLIAAAVQDNKTVLFVAEKMAALEVVKRRLDQVGLGNTCLELHSQKSKKTAVLEQLRVTLEASTPPEVAGQRQTDALRRTRDQLNSYVERLHAPIATSGLSTFEVMGEMVALRGEGVPPSDFSLVDSEKWTPVERNSRQELVRRAATLVEEVGLPNQHPWRGLGLPAMLPSDAERLTVQSAPVVPQLDDVAKQAATVAALLDLAPPETFGAMARLGEAIETLASPPAGDLGSLTSDCWKVRRGEIAELVKQGTDLSALKARLATIFVDAAWSADVTSIRRELLARARNWFRWMFQAYRDARRAYRNLCKEVPTGGPLEWIAQLDALIAAQELGKQIDAKAELGREAFGARWRGADSDWKSIAAIFDWVDRVVRLGAQDCLTLVRSKPEAMTQAITASKQLAAAAAACRSAVESLFDSLKLDVGEAFAVNTESPGEQIGWRCPRCGSKLKGVAGWLGQQNACPACGDIHECGRTVLAAVPLAEIGARLREWQSTGDRASEWIAYRAIRDEMRTLGLAPLAQRVDDGRLPAQRAVAQFVMTCDEVLLRRQMTGWPELARFQGRLHEQSAAEFCEQDRELLQLARKQVARRHAERIPRGDAKKGSASRNAAKDSPLGLIRHEINKKRRHLPVRQLLDQAGDVVQQIKPVFMMSPMSIAQFLPPGRLTFDLLVMDEASQVRPADALGAIGRAKQIVIVGDDQQLPPTRFFNAVLDEDGYEDISSETGESRDLESILGLCNARGLPSRMLRWHYRSRHHSLIAVSNREFYGGELVVVPSPVPCSSELGVAFRRVTSGVFDRGGAATNRPEAREVAQAVMEHAQRTPDRSLGVGCFSVAQRDAIIEELESLRRESAASEPFFTGDRAEPFFVKNLENIQGDERDEIFISVGYGRDAGGKLTMNFGPLSASGGERRLNVLITRARRRCTVFSSIVADDIDLSRASGRGPKVLKDYLEYCERTARDVPQGHAGAGEAIERHLAKRLADAGIQVVPQVGLTGLYIDLGVSDAETAGKFCLGIECDGANYRAARWARDRDRLRGQVLADHGWKLVRIWTPDWFFRPDDELRRVLQEVEAARREVAEQTNQ